MLYYSVYSLLVAGNTFSADTCTLHVFSNVTMTCACVVDTLSGTKWETIQVDDSSSTRLMVKPSTLNPQPSTLNLGHHVDYHHLQIATLLLPSELGLGRDGFRKDGFTRVGFSYLGFRRVGFNLEGLG